jgi:hypothetical protein
MKGFNIHILNTDTVESQLNEKAHLTEVPHYPRWERSFYETEPH